ncbi:hypothetical protein ANCDUO_26777 [Ancylostoma duodenale]|uniref:AMP-dependent synthetase/ligase domain-containing protein n=1 Tax=Ancylostoma duodenale TaxID=51022 RepID=A0A0C2C0S6_9BILA|nr:hypothetical protein ANCDUO_26777 [Ancylostoma duodenale]
MSEVCMASHLPDIVDGQPFGSVGKLASNLEMKIVDPENHMEKKRGDVGEICIRGPTVMLGYINKPKETGECIRDGWMHTGEIVRKLLLLSIILVEVIPESNLSHSKKKKRS